MSARVAKLRWSLLVGFVAVMAARRAYAQTTPCTVDTDCPGTACGTQVCAHDSGGIRCVDQGAVGSSGAEGWCADSSSVPHDSNCKCASLGATCDGFLCTFTVAPTGTGGTTGAGGGGGGAAGTAGTTGTAGTGSGTGGSTGSAGSSGGGSGGGGCCSVGGAPPVEGSLGLSLLAAALLIRRRRRF